jgi:16S rRNA processing protein RimM
VGTSESEGAYDVLVGVMVGAHGVRGEVRVNPETDFPERFADLEHIYMAPLKGEGRLVKILGARQHAGKGQVLLTLEGVGNREEAQALNGARLYIRPGELRPLPPGQYYEFQILGLQVSTEDGRDLGPVTDILRTGANDVYETPLALIPVVVSVIREVDLDQGRIVVRWMEGLLKE